jgi:RNA polymerase sigma-70 factor (ECF subfamily)
MTPILNPEASLSDYNYKGQPLSSFTDAKIVRLVKDGHEGAFAELYHRYNSDIYNYTLRLVSNPGVADDLIQEIFVAVWQGLDNFKGNSSIKTWLFRIAHNKAMSWMRTYYKIQDVEQVESENLSQRPMPDVQSMLNWRAEKVQEALGQLSADHRAVVELFYFMGLSYKEISKITDCPVGTVKSRMSYALKNLNNILINYGFES